MEQEIKGKRTRFVEPHQIDTLEPEQITREAPVGPTRIFGQQTDKIHDLYKLMVANMRKNTALDGQPPIYYPVEHCHFFHTYTSDGEEQNTSSVIGGHFHVMEIISPAIGDQPAVYKCSPPMKWGLVKDKYGRRLREMVLMNDEDLHTHDVQYIRSERLQLRKTNMEAVSYSAVEGAKYDKSVPGVQ